MISKITVRVSVKGTAEADFVTVYWNRPAEVLHYKAVQSYQLPYSCPELRPLTNYGGNAVAASSDWRWRPPVFVVVPTPRPPPPTVSLTPTEMPNTETPPVSTVVQMATPTFAIAYHCDTVTTPAPGWSERLPWPPITVKMWPCGDRQHGVNLIAQQYSHCQCGTGYSIVINVPCPPVT